MGLLELKKALKDFFPFLSLEEIDLLLSICEYKSYPSKAIILKSGKFSKMAFLILEGSVRGYILNESGIEKNILLRSKGIFVADADAIFGHQPQKLTIESLDQTRILMFSVSDFEELANKIKGIQHLYLESLKEAVLRLTYRVNSLITMTAEERYLDLMTKNPQFLKDAYDKYIANYLGITPVSFSRIKKNLNRS